MAGRIVIGVAVLAAWGGPAAAEPGSPASMRRFVYAVTLAQTGQQALHLAELTSATATAPRARTVMKLGTLPGDLGYGGQPPETFRQLLASRGNRLLASLTAQVGLDFVDNNVTVFDLATGAAIGSFNEHRFSATSKANCTSKKFNEFVASETANGTPPDVIAGYDFGVVTEGANIPSPVLTWTNDGKLRVRFTFDVLIKVGGQGVFDIGSDSFEYEMALGDGPAHAASCNAAPPVLGRPPRSRLGLRPAGSAHPGRITYDGVDLPFGGGGRKPLPPGFPVLTSFVKADRVGGYPQ